ncbi:hypothetical protein [Alicyclobacillus fodiniaquatilis]|uniref:Secreted protein n=1 Tax=Alicyclobacillus fodiniaquatilis TaxID=1661150 RepID=A0ABW4JGV9_9BACL
MLLVMRGQFCPALWSFATVICVPKHLCGCLNGSAKFGDLCMYLPYGGGGAERILSGYNVI